MYPLIALLKRLAPYTNNKITQATRYSFDTFKIDPITKRGFKAKTLLNRATASKPMGKYNKPAIIAIQNSGSVRKID